MSTRTRREPIAPRWDRVGDYYQRIDGATVYADPEGRWAVSRPHDVDQPLPQAHTFAEALAIVDRCLPYVGWMEPA